MIAVVDYSVGNVKSVCNAFNYLGCGVKLSCEPGEIEGAKGIVLPGVAAFGYARKSLGRLDESVRRAAEAGVPLLGICVGYQLLFDRSEEMGEHEGLGLVGGDVVAIPEGRVIPHMGWNKVELPGSMELFEGLGESSHFYFAHSYYAKVKDEGAEVAYTEYGFELPAAVVKGNVFGVQFHPEKSGVKGLRVLKNFAEICEKRDV